MARFFIFVVLLRYFCALTKTDFLLGNFVYSIYRYNFVSSDCKVFYIIELYSVTVKYYYNYRMMTTVKEPYHSQSAIFVL